jgi:Sulfatase
VPDLKNPWKEGGLRGGALSIGHGRANPRRRHIDCVRCGIIARALREGAAGRLFVERPAAAEHRLYRIGRSGLVIPSSHTYGLATDEWLLPQALKEAGYQTAIVGKWRQGHADPKYWPRQCGFDHQYGPLIGEID